MRSTRASPSDDWITFSVNPAVNGYHFLLRGSIRQPKERDVFRLSSTVPKIKWASNFIAATAISYRKSLPLPFIAAVGQNKQCL